MVGRRHPSPAWPTEPRTGTTRYTGVELKAAQRSSQRVTIRAVPLNLLAVGGLRTPAEQAPSRYLEGAFLPR